MFGKYHKLLQAGVLAGLCAHTIRLYLQDTINLYIHPRYSIFALVMAITGLLLLTAWLVFAWRRKLILTSTPAKKPKGSVVDFLVVALLVFAFILPAKPLSSQAVERKTANIPRNTQAATSSPHANRNCLDATPKSLQEWVLHIDAYPDPNCYKDAAVSVTGFVYTATDLPLPNGYVYLGRVVISCCVVDARPYALPLQVDKPYSKDTWLDVEGTLEARTINGASRLVVVPTKITPVEQPKDIYGY